MAQELQSILPEATDLKPLGGNSTGTEYLSVDYTSVTSLLIQAIKDLDALTRDCGALSDEDQSIIEHAKALVLQYTGLTDQHKETASAIDTANAHHDALVEEYRRLRVENAALRASVAGGGGGTGGLPTGLASWPDKYLS